jgi:diaminopimelate decarboxylase
LLEKYGSPLYVYDAEIVRRKAKALTEAAKGFHISYAMKANNNSHILNILRTEGVTNVDVVSPGEMFKALKVGYKPNQILYTENFISEEEIDYALK